MESIITNTPQEVSDYIFKTQSCSSALSNRATHLSNANGYYRSSSHNVANNNSTGYVSARRSNIHNQVSSFAPQKFNQNQQKQTTQEQEIHDQIHHQAKLEKLRAMRDRICKLETQEKSLQSNIHDLKSLLHKVNVNGEEKVHCLKTENGELKEKLQTLLQALEVSREQTYYLSDIYCYWSTCVNTKDYEKQRSTLTCEDDVSDDDSDCDFEIDEDLQRHLSSSGTASEKKIDSITISALTGTTTGTTTKDCTSINRRFSDCGEFTIPELSTQPSLSSSSQGDCLPNHHGASCDAAAAKNASIIIEAGICIGGVQESRRGGSLDCGMQGKRGLVSVVVGCEEESEQRERREEKQLQQPKQQLLLCAAANWNIIQIKSEPMPLPLPKHQAAPKLREYCLEDVDVECVVDFQ